MSLITEEYLKGTLPKNKRNLVNQNLIDTINNLDKDPAIAEAMRDNFISHLSIIKTDTHYSIEQYQNAVKFVTYILMGKTNIQAYALTFPQRYNDLLARGKQENDLSNYASMYKKNKLVSQILETAIIPAYVYNQDIFQKAIYVSADLMENAKSEMVRQKAAASLLEHLKKPEIKNLEINVPLNDEDSGLKDLKEAITKLAEKQIQMLNSGYTTKEIAESKIIEIEPENVTKE